MERLGKGAPCRIGGSITRGRLDEIRDEIIEYYGQLNELRTGSIKNLGFGPTNTKVPIKPGCLVTYELLKEMRIPLVSGGLMDQPHLWLLEYEVIDQTVHLMEALAPKQQ